jgi:hypothetical protein
MTVSTTTNKISYTGDSATVLFPFPYPFISATDLIVYLDDTALTYGTDYSVIGAGSSTGGSITCTAAPAIGTTVLIVRQVPYTQETDYQPNDPFPAQTHERALDKLTMMTQQIAEVSDRTIKLPVTTSASISTDLPSPYAGYMIGWNAGGSGLTNIDPATYYQAAGSYGFTVNNFTGNGSTTAFTLTNAVAAVANVEVFVNGVRQRSTSDYYLNGTNNTTLNFFAAPPSAALIFVRYGTTMATGVPANGSVTAQKMSYPGLGWTNLGRPYFNGGYRFTSPAYSPTGITLTPDDYLTYSLIVENASNTTYSISTASLATIAAGYGITVANGFAVEFRILNVTGGTITLSGLTAGYYNVSTISSTSSGTFAVVYQNGSTYVIRTR